MRMLVYSDLQATEGSERCRHQNLPLQRYRVEKFYAQLAALKVLHRCETIVDLGDTTDDHAFVYRATLDVVLAGIQAVTTEKRGFVKLTGNHEQLLKGGQLSAENLFTPYFSNTGNGTHWVDGVAYVFRSYTDQYDVLNAELSETVAALRKEKPRAIILFAHGDVHGVRYASGEICTKGLTLTTLDLFDRALLGHVHGHQMVIRDKAWFLGSPFQQDFGEANQEKFVAILDDAAKIPTLEFIPVTGFPRYLTMSLKDFMAAAETGTEDRYLVQLTSIEETEKFYANPLSALAKTQLTYTTALTKTAEANGELSTDRRKLVERYVKERPLEGIDLDQHDVVDFAVSFLDD